VYDQLDFENTKDLEDIRRGLVAPLPDDGGSPSRRTSSAGRLTPPSGR
jgi:hypothetical protein